MNPKFDKRQSASFGSASRMLQQAHASNVRAPVTGGADRAAQAIQRLTPRQREVLAVMMQGKCNKAISRSLNLAVPTVKNHVTAILRALNATNRTEAVVKFAKISASPTRYLYAVAGYSTSLTRSPMLMRPVDEDHRQLDDQNIC